MDDSLNIFCFKVSNLEIRKYQQVVVIMGGQSLQSRPDRSFLLTPETLKPSPQPPVSSLNLQDYINMNNIRNNTVYYYYGVEC